MPKQTYETTDYLKAVERLIRRGGVRVADADEIELGQLLKLQQTLKDAIEVAVLGQIERGRSWQQIANATGTSRVTAFQRWSPNSERRPGKA